jgi:lysophospholipase L1-like esterase
VTALSVGFAWNLALLFYLGLGALISTLVVGTAAAQRRRVRAFPQLGLVLLAILVAFSSVELAWTIRDAWRPGPGVFGAEFHSYDAARNDRTGFQRWWKLHLRRWAQLDPNLVMPDPRGLNPYVLIPGAVVQRGASRLEINRLGFRGAHIAAKKRKAYRIVALGESTTFGITVAASDRTWPVVLQERIARELDCDRPIEVINAGVPGWSLANQVARLHADVFPLEPDLLLSYHGSNDFPFFLNSVAKLRFTDSSAVRSRPSRILEGAERALRVRPILAAQPRVNDHSIGDKDAQVELRAYADLYSVLVREGRSSGADVALCTFNLAVNEKSDEEAIQFFEERYPDVRSMIVANRLHTRIVGRVADARGAIAIDTSAKLDGGYRDGFVDLVHFTQSGRDQLAVNILGGLRTFLRDHPRVRCRERSGIPASAQSEPP